jgi:hypothetical protein
VPVGAPFARIARGAFAAKGALYLAIAALTVREDLTRPSSATRAVMVAVDVGLIFACLYKLIEAVARPTGSLGSDAVVTRLARFATGIGYAILAFMAVHWLDDSLVPEVHWSAQLMERTLGRLSVALVGVLAIGFGGQQLYRAHAGECLRKLDYSQMHGLTRRLVRPFASFAYAGRGIAFGLLGLEVIRAAVEFDLETTPRGVAGVLENLPQTVAIASAVGLGAYALFCLFILARYFVPRT